MGQKPSTSLADVAALSVRVQKRYLTYLPAYTNHAAAITPETLATAKQHWLKIVAGTSAFAVHREEEREGCKPSEPISFFYDAFFNELFAVAPSARNIFKGQMVRQGNALIGMFTWMVNLDLTQSATELASRLEALADRHVAYGCNAWHYDAVGLATFHALRVCSGAEDWTPSVQAAWVDIYSIFLLVMVPRTVIKMEELGLDASHSEPLSPQTAELLGASGHAMGATGHTVGASDNVLSSSEHYRGGFSPALSPGPASSLQQQGRSGGFSFSRSLRRKSSASALSGSTHSSGGGSAHGGGGGGGTPQASGAAVTPKGRSGTAPGRQGGEVGAELNKSGSGLRGPKMRFTKRNSAGGGSSSNLGLSDHQRSDISANDPVATSDADSNGYPGSPIGGREGAQSRCRSPRGSLAVRNGTSSPRLPPTIEDVLPRGIVPLDMLPLDKVPSSRPQGQPLLPPPLPPRPTSVSSSTGTDGQETVAVGPEPTSPSNASSGGSRDSGSVGRNSAGRSGSDGGKGGHQRSKTGSMLMFVQMAVPEHPAPLPVSARRPKKGVRAEGEAVTFEDLSHLACV